MIRGHDRTRKFCSKFLEELHGTTSNHSRKAYWTWSGILFYVLLSNADWFIYVGFTSGLFYIVIDFFNLNIK